METPYLKKNLGVCGHTIFELCDQISLQKKGSQNSFCLFILGLKVESYKQTKSVESLVTLSL